MPTFVRIVHKDESIKPAVVTEAAAKRLEDRGWHVDRAAESATDTEDPQEIPLPHKNGSTDEWRTYGVARGLTPEQVAGMSRDELVDHFTATPTKES